MEEALPQPHSRISKPAPPPENTFKHFQTSFWYPSSLTTRRKPSESPYIIERQILPTLFSQSYHYFPGHRYHNPPHQTSCRKQNKDISINPLSNSPSSMNPTLSLYTPKPEIEATATTTENPIPPHPPTRIRRPHTSIDKTEETITQHGYFSNDDDSTSIPTTSQARNTKYI